MLQYFLFWSQPIIFTHSSYIGVHLEYILAKAPIAAFLSANVLILPFLLAKALILPFDQILPGGPYVPSVYFYDIICFNTICFDLNQLYFSIFLYFGGHLEFLLAKALILPL